MEGERAISQSGFASLAARTRGQLRTAVLKGGGVSLMRSMGSRGVRILLYHRFSTFAQESLAAQCAHLRKHYHLVSLDEIAGWLRKGETLPKNSLAVTVDDGYRDFYQNAYPIFSAHQIPVTIFLATEFLDHRAWLWVDRVNYACEHTRVRAAKVRLGPEDAREFRFLTHAQRRQAATSIRESAKRLSNSERLDLVADELPRLLKVDVPSVATEEYEPLLWDEVREMSAHRIDFGAHTMTHPILSSLRDREALIREIEGSKHRIESELNKPVLHFSYPNGTWDDLHSDAVEVVKSASFSTAVVAQGGVNFRNADPFLLRRNTVEPESPELVFGRFATGFRRN